MAFTGTADPSIADIDGVLPQLQALFAGVNLTAGSSGFLGEQHGAGHVGELDGEPAGAAASMSTTPKNW